MHQSVVPLRIYLILYLFSEPFPPPNNVHLNNISPVHLIFSWSPLALSCPSLSYIITSTTDCGICPNTSTKTSVTCNNITVSGQTCSYYVQTKICGNLVGRKSQPLVVKLKGGYTITRII